MTAAQTRLRALRDRQSKERGRMAELAQSGLPGSDETARRARPVSRLGCRILERQLARGDHRRRGRGSFRQGRGRQGWRQGCGPRSSVSAMELRGRASVGRYLSAALRGRAPDGAEAELAAAAGVDGIPMELWQYPEERRDEDRAITPAPGTVGLNLDVLRPAVFAPSIASRLMIDMPVVQSGTYATATLGAGATADAVDKGDAVPDTAATWTPVSTTPHRVGAALDLSLEDIAAVGAENFESVLRQHISLVLADEIDDQIVNGDGANDDLIGDFPAAHQPGRPGRWRGRLRRFRRLVRQRN